MANLNKLASLFDRYKVMVVLPGGDGWFTDEEKATIAKALRDYADRQPIVCRCRAEDRALCPDKDRCAPCETFAAPHDIGERRG